MIGRKPAQSPTIYMIGDSPCGFLADQVLSEDGITNYGNKYPSNLQADLLPLCVEAAQAINQVWKLDSNWGLDFVINTEGIPVIVDLNMGRPNGNFAVRMSLTESDHLSIPANVQSVSVFPYHSRLTFLQGIGLGETEDRGKSIPKPTIRESAVLGASG